MTKNRRYRLLCPIARALDRLGDRWTLLILRDLHAGPARFSDLQSGFPGIASNLLSTRLRQMIQDDLICRREAAYGVSVYELTPKGSQTGSILFELAAFGSSYPADDEPITPGNLRLLAVTLTQALQRVAHNDDCHNACLIIDLQQFSVRVAEGIASVRYEKWEDAPLVIRTQYQSMVATSDGLMSLDDFAAHHMQIIRGTPKEVGAFMNLMGRAISLLMP